MVERDKLLVFGKRLRKVREGRDLTQEELADIAEFDRTYVSLVERGRRNLSLLNLCRFAAALGKRPADLIRDL